LFAEELVLENTARSPDDPTDAESGDLLVLIIELDHPAGARVLRRDLHQGRYDLCQLFGKTGMSLRRQVHVVHRIELAV